MFKYIWIIMLVISGLLFVGYTALCIYSAYIDYVKYCERYEIPVTPSRLVDEIFDDLTSYHPMLLMSWTLIICAILVTLFVLSLNAYLSKTE